MKKPTHIMIGGLVALGFDASGRFLLTVSHSGRGVFAVESWQRVARDAAVSYPEDGVAIGIGPIAGERIPVSSRDEKKESIELTSPDGRFTLLGEPDGITMT